ncbi:hypothetical protein [Sorangium sp. So ce388]|uniref:hypothetical protein n=1 Tax=Sorangium sp. So ce388 TaxID=3133309 RepID=UPI003F5CB188
MMRPATASEWRDATGGVGCWCDSHDLEICGRRRHAEPCTCRCHYRADLRLVPSGAAPKESSMRREAPIEFRPCDEETPDTCSECLALDDDHPLSCSRGRRLGREGIEAAGHYVGSVHETGPGEDVPLEGETDTAELSLAQSALTSRAPNGGRAPRRDGRAGRSL